MHTFLNIDQRERASFERHSKAQTVGMPGWQVSLQKGLCENPVGARALQSSPPAQTWPTSLLQSVIEAFGSQSLTLHNTASTMSKTVFATKIWSNNWLMWGADMMWHLACFYLLCNKKWEHLGFDKSNQEQIERWAKFCTHWKDIISGSREER